MSVTLFPRTKTDALLDARQNLAKETGASYGQLLLRVVEVSSGRAEPLLCQLSVGFLSHYFRPFLRGGYCDGPKDPWHIPILLVTRKWLNVKFYSLCLDKGKVSAA